MENQNNKPNNEMRPEGASAHNGGRHGRHRGRRGRGGNRPENGGAAQDNRVKQGATSGEGAPAEQTGGKSRNHSHDRQNQNGGKGQGAQQNAQGGKKNRGRGRGGEHRERTHGEAPAASNAVERNTLQTNVGALNSSRSLGDKWLDDTFSPLHEVELNDPAAEETARRILDAEGPLLFREEPEQEIEQIEEPEGETVEIVGIRFKTPGKVYFFAPGKLRLGRGTHVIVETARGMEYGEVCRGNTLISATEVVQPLRPVLRAATEEDALHNEQNKQKEDEAFRICQGKIVEHGLDMKLVEAQYTFDNSKLLFYFTSDGRVDFRELVKDLAGVFRTRIELRQIGIRDEAKLLGGLGTCGRPLCCAGFLSDFVQVSIKMAKEQNLSLNANKISGCCGRLMCCLRYEFDTYETEIRLTPSVGSSVETPDGRGDVIANHPLKGTVTVRLSDHADEAPRVYHRDMVTVYPRERAGAKKAVQEAVETTDEGSAE